MARGKHSDIFGPVDTAFYYVDGPATPMNIGALTIFEGKILFDDFVHLVEIRIQQAPLYMQRVIQAPLHLGPPTWVLDPDFFVENHVFQTTLDAPGTDEQLRKLAGHLMSGMLDRSKPLWEAHLIEGLEGNRSAVFFKVHHCMVDGLAAVELFKLMLDPSPDMPPAPSKPPVRYHPPELPDWSGMIVNSVMRDVPHKLGVLQKMGSDMLFLGGVFADKDKRRKALVGVANLINDNIQPIKKLIINGKNTGKMTMAWSEFSLNEVHSIRAACKASVNDVMLTLLGMAVESYLDAHGDASGQQFLRALVPVNMRADEDRDAYGNRISVLPVDIPFGISDPLERLRAVSEYARMMKQSSLSTGLDMILSIPSLFPALTQPLVWETAPVAFSLLAHTWCTNVASPPIPLYLLGHQMLHSYGYFPLNPSMGLASVVVSYNQRITMTLVADGGIVPDVCELRDDLENAYIALRRSARVQPEVVPEKKVSEPVSKEVKVEAVKPVETAPVRTAVTRREQIAEPVSAAPSSEVRVEQVPAEPLAALADTAKTISDPVPPQPVVEPLSSEVHVETVKPVEVPAELPSLEVVKTISEPVCSEPIVETQSPPEVVIQRSTVQPVSNNGASVSAALPESVSAVVIEAEPAPDSEQPVKLFSEPWAEAMQTAINNSRTYYEASTTWVAGPLAFVMRAAPQYGYPLPTAVLLDLRKGRCREAHSVPLRQAYAEASFVIEGDYENWNRVLCGEAQPLMMLMRGKLHLSKGSMARLLPFTRSAQELVHCAQQV
jgi:diacylglycerol O-acyltransferase / wax synthase